MVFHPTKYLLTVNKQDFMWVLDKLVIDVDSNWQPNKCDYKRVSSDKSQTNDFVEIIYHMQQLLWQTCGCLRCSICHRDKLYSENIVARNKFQFSTVTAWQTVVSRCFVWLLNEWYTWFASWLFLILTITRPQCFSLNHT